MPSAPITGADTHALFAPNGSTGCETLAVACQDIIGEGQYFPFILQLGAVSNLAQLATIIPFGPTLSDGKASPLLDVSSGSLLVQ